MSASFSESDPFLVLNDSDHKIYFTDKGIDLYMKEALTKEEYAKILDIDMLDEYEDLYSCLARQQKSNYATWLAASKKKLLLICPFTDMVDIVISNFPQSIEEKKVYYTWTQSNLTIGVPILEASAGNHLRSIHCRHLARYHQFRFQNWVSFKKAANIHTLIDHTHGAIFLTAAGLVELCKAKDKAENRTGRIDRYPLFFGFLLALISIHSNLDLGLGNRARDVRLPLFSANNSREYVKIGLIPAHYRKRKLPMRSDRMPWNNRPIHFVPPLIQIRKIVINK